MYVESMGRTLQNLFKNYYAQLVKLDSVMATKGDLIAVEEATLKSMFTQKVDMTKRNDTFALGERDKILEQVRHIFRTIRQYDIHFLKYCKMLFN